MRPSNLPRKMYREVFRVIAESDISIEVLDSRFPYQTRSAKVESFVSREKKSLILCMNKCDLVPLRVLYKWKKKLSKSYPTVFFSARHRHGSRILRKTISRYGKQNNDVFCCLFGLPNTGKSSISNILKGRHAAPTSPIPGYTKSLQFLRIGPQLLFIDTPGIIPSNEFEPELQVFLGTIPVTKLEDPITSLQIVLNRMKHFYTKGFLNFYKLDTFPQDIESVLETLAKKRGRLLKGGIADGEGMARIMLKEF
ncbi:MAG: GTPase, partial [Promethearchaeota archaeon]